MSTSSFGPGIEITGRVTPEYAQILTADAVAFAAKLQRAFGGRRADLLARRAQRAEAFSAKVRDVHELLASHEPRAERHPVRLKVAYHDACHLAHAQGVRQPPRELLRAIPDLELVEPAEWELCCGSAGIWNLMQPEAAGKLGTRKAANLAATGAQAIAAANPGCALQIAAHLEQPIPVLHPMTLLDHSIRNKPLREAVA